MLSYQWIALLVLQLLQVAGSKNTISPSYVWPLRFIYNKTVPVVPPLAVHGGVQKDDSGLHFDGKTAWLDAGELPGSCISQPQTCSNGLSIALRVKLLNSNTTASSPQFLVDSGGFNGEGVSLYMKDGQIYGEVADKKRFWRVSTELDSAKWHFVLLTWSIQDGLILFIDGPMKAQNSQPMSFQLKPVATSKHIILGRCNAETGATFAAFSSDMVALFDSVTPDGKVYLSYSFSAPSTRGNIRYVNAKFMNAADFDLTIFPDRGEHQKTGYQLEAHSSTLLEYVLREGQLPVGMNFRLQNKKNGEELRLNAKYDLHVISSDDKQVVKEYRIQQDATIKTALSTSAVSINYQIKPAGVTIEQPVAGTGAQPTNIASGSQQTNAASESQQTNVAAGLQPTNVASGLQQTSTAPSSQQPKAASGAQQTNVASGSQQTNVASGSQQTSDGMPTTDEQNALIDNPENPLDEENTGNKTAPSEAATKPSLNQQGGLQTASNATNATSLTNGNNTKPPPEITSTIAPTVPPPPQFSTPKPTYNKTETNVTQTGGKVVVSNQGNGTSIPSPKIPDDDAELSGLDLNLNTSGNATSEGGTDQDLEELLEGAQVNMTSTGNATSALNTTSTNTTAVTNTTTNAATNANANTTPTTTTTTNNNTSSSNDTETPVPVTTVENVSSTVTPNVAKEEKLTTTAKPTEAKNVTHLILTSANNSSVNETNGQNASKPIEPSQVSGNVLEKFVPTNPKTGDAKKPIAAVNSQNPWMVIAKQTQGQQRPILWRNGQGIHKAIYGSVDQENKQEGIAPVNYNAGSTTKVENVPVWQQVNGQPDINDWFTKDKLKNDQGVVSSSPFKFANPKTQQEVNSYYAQNKFNDDKKKQRGLS